jgi:hypothetical protein
MLFDDFRCLHDAYRLLGLFIWAIDEDTDNHDLLNAVLYPDGLGKFAAQNSDGYTDNSNYTTVEISQCLWTGTDTHFSFYSSLSPILRFTAKTR